MDYKIGDTVAVQNRFSRKVCSGKITKCEDDEQIWGGKKSETYSIFLENGKAIKVDVLDLLSLHKII